MEQAFETSEQKRIAMKNLKHDSQTEQYYHNLIDDPSWPYFYEFVRSFTSLQEILACENSAAFQNHLNVNFYAKKFLALIDHCEDGFLGLNKKELECFLREIESPQVLIMYCESLIKRCVAKLEGEKFNILLNNTVSEDKVVENFSATNEKMASLLFNMVENKDISQELSITHTRRRRCVIL